MRGPISSLVVSMALAFFLWLSLAGQDTSLVDLTVGLNFHSLPDNLYIRGETPKEVSLKLMANAAQGRFLADRKLSLPLDLSKAQEGHNAFPVLLEPLQLPRGVEVSEFQPETVEFEAISLSQKELPVTPQVVGQLAPGFQLNDLVLDPPAVTVQGPPEILAKMDHLDAMPLAVDQLTEDAVLAVNVILPPEGSVTIVSPKKEIQAFLRISENRTQIVLPDIPVEIKLMTGERLYGPYRDPIRPPGPRHLPDTVDHPAVSFSARPAQVSFTVSWPSSRSRPVSADEVRALVSVDSAHLNDEGRMTMPVEAMVPDGARVEAVTPEMVDVSYGPPAAKTRKVKP